MRTLTQPQTPKAKITLKDRFLIRETLMDWRRLQHKRHKLTTGQLLDALSRHLQVVYAPSETL